MHHSRHSRAALALASLFVILSACTEEARTEILVVVDADPMVKSQTRGLLLAVRGAALSAPTNFGAPDNVDLTGSALVFPVSLGIVPKDNDGTRRFEVFVQARSALPGTSPVITSVRARGTFVPGETRVLRIVLEDSCISRACSATETCRSGACASAEVDTSMLPTYMPDAGSAPVDARVGDMARVDLGVGDASIDGGAPEEDLGTRDFGTVCPDADADGETDARCGGTDCDDSRADVSTVATEVCDEVDNDCDAMIDEGVQLSFYQDADGDGYGAPDAPTSACAAPAGYVADGTDCDDAQVGVAPGRAEVCDTLDNDCNGLVDDGVLLAFYRDSDTDGFGNAASTTDACTMPVGYVSNATDCDDGRGEAYPGATEVCDSIDNDCDASVDEGVLMTFYRDADGDGYGNSGSSTQACSRPAGYVTNTTDCNDSRGDVSPGRSETCDGADNNCNGTVDEGVRSTYYRDADGDGYGNAASTTQACSAPGGYVTNASDCNDGRGDAYPGRGEVCDGIDNNCNGSIDEGVRNTYYRDADGDGYGNGSSTTTACSTPSGYASRAGDCYDGNASANVTCYRYRAATTGTVSQCCHWDCVNPQSVPYGGLCGAGWYVSGVEAERLDAGGGNCSATASGTSAVISTSCNTLEGTMCRGLVSCRANGT